MQAPLLSARRASARVPASHRAAVPAAPSRRRAGPVPGPASSHRRLICGTATGDAALASDAPPPPRRVAFVQDKASAKLFYAFLAQVYDHIVNPGHWTPSMRADALAPLKLAPTHRVVDVGAGTGFCTQGVVAAGVPPASITMVDQSPHQLAKARRKADLAGVTILEGDAEAVPLASDAYDRYVSAGSIEYWPDPQMGIAEAYRLVKPGGLACIIGPVRPTHPVSRAFADAWMLFPEEREYMDWFAKAGFVDVSLTRIGPPWYRGSRRHGLIMGCSVVGRKPVSGPSPHAEAVRKAQPVGVAVADIGKRAPRRSALAVAARVVLGSLAGFYYFVLPIYMWLKNLVWPQGWPM